MSYTPGPWYLEPRRLGAPMVRTTEREIAQVRYHGGSEDREVASNARLITAAPELLEATEAARAALGWQCQDCEAERAAAIEALEADGEGCVPLVCDHNCPTRHALDKIAAAIAKAKGGEKHGG